MLTFFGTISKPNYPDHVNWRLETDIGKRAAYCDFDNPDDMQRFFKCIKNYKFKI